jgi:hypothetical protein
MGHATIYSWGGGREAFARRLNRFYDLVELDLQISLRCSAGASARSIAST